MRRFSQLLCVVSLALFATWQVGCNRDTTTDSAAVDGAEGVAGTDSHSEGDHGHDHDLSFEESIGKIETLAATIGESMDQDDADAVHDELHEIGHLLEELPALASEHGLSADDQTKLQGAVEKLMDAYGAIDATMHGEEGKSWDEVKGDVDEGLKTLTSFEHSHS